MIKSMGRGAVLLMTGGALALSAAAVPASAANSVSQRARTAPPGRTAGTGWRVARTLSVRGGSVELFGIDAVSGADAWVAGIFGPSNNSRQTPLIEHWNGRTWRSVSLPAKAKAQFARPVPFGIIGASSSGSVWAFNVTGRYLRLRGRAWTVGQVPGAGKGHVFLDATTVFSATNVWVFGARFIGPVATLNIVPFAARFSSGRWRTVRIPGRGFISVSAVSADDMWGLTGTLTPGTGLVETPTVLHWNGTAWRRQTRQPRLFKHASLDAILAESDSNVWIGGAVPNTKTGTSELAEHFNGRAWRTDSPHAAPSDADLFLTSLVPDGGGGLWAIGAQFPGPSRFWHRTGGAWSAPVKVNPRWLVFQLDHAPRTRSVWAIGSGPGLVRGLILLHGPVPH